MSYNCCYFSFKKSFLCYNKKAAPHKEGQLLPKIQRPAKCSNKIMRCYRILYIFSLVLYNTVLFQAV